MAKPLVAIVGRPNVGKSMLFNKLTGQRTSIVEDTPGVTRDRIYGSCEWCGRTFSLVDTGGIEPGTDSEMLKFMRRQAEIAVGTGIHLIMIGGAGCLYADGSETVCVYEMPDHPAFLKGISWNLVQGYEQLKHTDDVDWTFVCPSKLLDPDGPRTGDYLTRTDRHIPINEDGNSYVSYDDLAIAMVDFGQNGSFKRQLVAVASRRGGPQA